jgi:hypothetical protein
MSYTFTAWLNTNQFKTAKFRNNTNNECAILIAEVLNFTGWYYNSSYL